MSINNQRICDRVWCGRPIQVPYQVIEVQYHHPKKLDLCKDCEAEFMLWLGQHPLFGTTIQQVADGNAMGDGYPTRERAQEFLRERESAETFASVNRRMSSRPGTSNKL